jgi:hypothetical protein
MRAAEFMRALADIIDKLDGNGAENDLPAKDPAEKDDNPIMIPPLQQQLELDKAEAGKDSPIIQKLTQDEVEPNPSKPIFRTR